MKYIKGEKNEIFDEISRLDPNHVELQLEYFIRFQLQ